MDLIRENNSHLDLSPARFLNSIEFEYREAFELFDKGYLDKRLRPDLLEIVNALDGKSSFKTLFNPCRSLLEAICQGIIKKEPDLIPYRVRLAKSGVNLKNCLDYLSGEKVRITSRDGKRDEYSLREAAIPAHVSICVKTCKELADKSSHFYGPTMSIFAYRSAVYALLETLAWLKDFNERA